MSQADLSAGKKHDPYRIGRPGAGVSGAGARSERGPAPQRIVTSYGFWIFLLSDIVMFSAFFAAYAVLQRETDNGPGAKELFEQPRLVYETICLLLSSFTCGFAAVAAERRNMLGMQLWLFATGLLGLGFLVLEIGEFRELLAQGAGPQRSAFLSAFFALVGCHGLHVFIGLLWLGTMMAQLWIKGFREHILRRLTCFNLFWHALDIVWVAIFTIVYLVGIQ